MVAVEIVVAILLGVGFAILLARLMLGGVLALAFARARNFVKLYPGVDPAQIAQVAMVRVD